MSIGTRGVVAIVAYLIGTKKEIWTKQYIADVPEVVESIVTSREANILRYLCKLRSQLFRNFKRTDDALRWNLDNIDRMEWYDTDNVKKLMRWEVPVILTNKKAQDYAQHFNRLIRDNVDACRMFFPEWVEWSYIKSLFVIPRFENNDVLKQEQKKYMDNNSWYPYQMYIYWKRPYDAGNLLGSDKKFLDILYGMHNDFFQDTSKTHEAEYELKENIYQFIDRSTKVELVVDCENSDVYKFYSALQSLNEEELAKLHKIVLYDDVNTTDGWDFLEKFIQVPVEHIEVERVVEHKSLVDIRMSAGITKSCYTEGVTSVILLSSDSDYWALISQLPEIDFLVMIEYAKCGNAIKEHLEEKGYYYCSLDDFGSGQIDSFKRSVLFGLLQKELPYLLGKNGLELTKSLFTRARIEATDKEIKNFYDLHVRTMQLHIDSKGCFEIILH